jgi:hypothetical protein
MPRGQAGTSFQQVLATVSAATTAGTVNTTPVAVPFVFQSIVFTLDLTAAAAASGDTLDVVVQTKLDGTNWTDIVHFTQATGTGGAKRYIAKVTLDGSQTMFEVGTALTAGNTRNLAGDQFRVSYTIVDGGAHGQSFTFTVTAQAA